MPGILPIYDVNHKVVNERGTKERSERQKQIDRWWAYYDGQHDEPLKIRPGEKNDNIILNLCQRTVDKTVEFMGIPARLELPGGVDNVRTGVGLVEQRSPQQEALDNLWEAGKFEAPEIIESALIAGHVFLKLNLDDDGAYQIDLIDPRFVTVFWDERNTKRTLFYRMEWAMGDDKRRLDIVPNWLLAGAQRPTTELRRMVEDAEQVTTIAPGWQMIEYTMENRAAWTEVTRDDWPYDFAPIVDMPIKRRAHRYYGVSQLSGAVQHNNAVNFIASNTGRIIKYHAHPRTIAPGMEPEDVQGTSVDGLFTVPEDVKPYNLEMSSDLSSSLNFLTLLKAEFFAAQRVTDLSSVKDKLGQITNFGVRMIFSEQLEATEEKRNLIGEALAEAYRRLMILNGYGDVETPIVKWDDPLPANKLERIQAAKDEVELGVSKQSVFKDLGRDYVTETEMRTEEGEQGTDNVVNLLDRMGQSGMFGRVG